MGCNCGSKAAQAKQAATTAQRREASEIRRLAEQQAKEQAQANTKK